MKLALRILSFIFALVGGVCSRKGRYIDSSIEESVNLPILMYHSVCNYHTNDYVLSPEKFEKDLLWLQENGYQAIFFSQAANFCDRNEDLPKKPVVITFDDGYYNNFSIVLPLVKKYDFPCEINIVGSYVEETSSIRKDNYSYLTATEILSLTKSKMFEVGNHSYDMHKQNGRMGVLKKRHESQAEYARVLLSDSETCRDLLYSSCRIRTDIYAFPFGFYSKSTIKILESAGYRWFLTCEEGMNHLKRGEKGALKLCRYNRPNRYDTSTFFKKCGMSS